MSVGFARNRTCVVALLSGLLIASLFTSSSRAQQQAVVSYTSFNTGPVAPVFTGGGPGAWDEIVREKLSVIQDGSTYKMWYTGHRSGSELTSHVGYATSSDGINWTRYPGNPIINRNEGESKDQDICVLKRADGTLVMYVEVNDMAVDLFTSTDGINWTPDPSNPVKTGAASPVIWREGSSWFMLYETGSPTYSIFLATSPDGIVWTDSPANPVLAEADTTVPDAVLKEGSTYHLYYHRFNGGWPGWHAVSTDLVNWTQRQLLFPYLTSQSFLMKSDGSIWSYLWSQAQNNYYVRYAVPAASPTTWPLDEAIGTTFSDNTGVRADGKLFNGAAWVAGHAGTALMFDGIDDYASIGYFANLPVWTVSVWAKSPAAPANGLASGPVQRHSNFQINWNHSSGRFQGAAALKVLGVEYGASFGALDANTWYHLVATYDGETLKAYRNGVLVTSNTTPSGPADSEAAPLTLAKGLTGGQFQGTVDDVRIFDRPLTAPEIADLAGVPPPDTTPPSAPSGLTATANGEAVGLAWAAASDLQSGVAEYRLYRGTVAAGTKTLRATVGPATFEYNDTQTGPNTTYYYQVTAVNGVGIEGLASNEASALTGNLPPPPPTGLSATAASEQIALNWSNSPAQDLAGYNVFRSTTASGPFSRINTSLVLTSDYSDTGLVNGTRYYYVVTAIDLAAQESNPSASVFATAGVPPAPSSSLIAYWQLDEGAGTTAVDSSGHGLTATLLNGTAWTTGVSGEGVTFDGINDYVSTTFNQNLPAWTVAFWVRSPAAPANAISSSPVHRQKTFQFNWNHEDARFRGAVALRVNRVWHAASFGPLQANTWYHLTGTYDGETLRAYRDGVVVSENTAPAGPPEDEIAPLLFGKHSAANNFFQGSVDDVRIYDRALESQDVATLARVDDSAPSAPGSLTATAVGQSVALSWTAAFDAETGIGQYRIYRGTSPGPGKVQIAAVGGSALQYTDSSTGASTAYFYEVTAANPVRLEGPPSPEASAVTGDSPPLAPANVTALAGNGQVALNWDDNGESDLAGYRVYRRLASSSTLIQIGPPLVTVSAYTDTSVINETSYVYVVTALDVTDHESQASAPVPATPTMHDVTLAGNWELDEGTGTVAVDASIYGRNGNIRNGALWVPGVMGAALSFDGINDYVNIPYTENPTSWTVAVWVKSPASPTTGLATGPVHRNKTFQINWNHPDPNFRGSVALKAGQWYSASFGPLAADTWYHLVATYDGDTLKAYRNGVLVSTNTGPSGPPDPETLPLMLARNAGAGNYFAGTIDGVRVYTRPLTAAEIAALAGVPQP